MPLNVSTDQQNVSSKQESGLRHQLSAGQMAMVAVGGSIGTGLLLGSAAAIQIAGPAVILSFALAAFICWTVTMAFGELSSVHPAAGSFGLYADLYLNPWAGFVSRAGYWIAISVSVGANLVASATYMRYWLPYGARSGVGRIVFGCAYRDQSPQCQRLRTIRVLVRDGETCRHGDVRAHWGSVIGWRARFRAIYGAGRIFS